jgi:hypothetical protein
VARLRALLLACVLVPTALAGCGGGDGKTGTGADRGGPGGKRNVDPVPAESVKDAINRIQGAVTASGCEAVKGLLHSTYGQVSNDACRAVKAELGGFRDPNGAAYGTGAGVDFQTVSGQNRLAALVLDADRTFRLDFVMDVAQPTADTPKPPEFDRNAEAVVRALQIGNCDAFLRLASRNVGLGVGSDEEVCRRVSEVPFRRELVDNRGASPKPLGGNGWLAFYKLRTRPDAYYTMVMAREDPTTAGARPRYVLVNALPAG